MSEPVYRDIRGTLVSVQVVQQGPQRFAVRFSLQGSFGPGNEGESVVDAEGRLLEYGSYQAAEDAGFQTARRRLESSEDRS